MRNPKSEMLRNPKHEIRNPKQYLNSNFPLRGEGRGEPNYKLFRTLEFRIWDLFRI